MHGCYNWKSKFCDNFTIKDDIFEKLKTNKIYHKYRKKTGFWELNVFCNKTKKVSQPEVKGCDTFCVKLKIVLPDLPKLQFYRRCRGSFIERSSQGQPVPYNYAFGDADTGKEGSITQRYCRSLQLPIAPAPVASEPQGLDSSALQSSLSAK